MKQNDPMTMVLSKLDDLSTEVKNKFDDLSTDFKNKFDDLSTEFKALRTDVTATKSNVQFLDLRLGAVETRSKAMQADLGDIKRDIRRLEILHEETDGKIESILEITSSNSKQITQTNQHEEEQDDTILFHERRINFLEKKVA